MSVTNIDLHPKSSPKDFKVTTAFQGSRQRLSFTLHDRDGKILDLTNNDFFENGDEEAIPNTPIAFDDNIAVKRTDDLEVRFLYRLGISSSSMPFAVIGKITDAACGKVSFTFNPKDLQWAGIYYGQIQVGRRKNEAYVEGSTDGMYLFYTYPLFITVEPNMDSPYTGDGLTIPEVRAHLMDSDPAQNLTLGEYEFSDSEIMSAAKHAVDIWNDELPPIVPLDPANFPFKSKWLDGIAAILLTRIANRKRRNTLQYSAGGVSTDDQNYSIYEQVGQQKLAEYRAWVQEKKMSINMGMGFSSYGGIGF